MKHLIYDDKTEMVIPEAQQDFRAIELQIRKEIRKLSEKYKINEIHLELSQIVSTECTSLKLKEALKETP